MQRNIDEQLFGKEQVGVSHGCVAEIVWHDRPSLVLGTGKIDAALGMEAAGNDHLPRPTVFRDTALQVEDCKEEEDGRGRWGGRGYVGARPTRWRRRSHARAPAA